MIGDACPGRNRSTCARGAGSRAPPPSELHSTSSAARAAPGVRRCRRGGEDVGPRGVDDELDIARGPGDEAAERTQASSRASRCAARRRRAARGLWDREPRALRRARAARRAGAQIVEQRIDVGGVAVHREHGVAHDDRAPLAARGEHGIEVLEVTVAEDRHARLAQPAAVDDRCVVQLVRAHEHIGATERGEDAEIGGEPRREQRGALGPLPAASASSSSAWTGRDPTISARRPGSRTPTVEGGVRGGDDRGCAVSPR